MAHITLLVCDECIRLGSNDTSREVHTYTVQEGSARARVDLCREHDGYLRTILVSAGAPAVESSHPTISGARFEELCADMEEVELAKKHYRELHPERFR